MLVLVLVLLLKLFDWTSPSDSKLTSDIGDGVANGQLAQTEPNPLTSDVGDGASCRRRSNYDGASGDGASRTLQWAGELTSDIGDWAVVDDDVVVYLQYYYYYYCYCYYYY